jgi:hypothetical protein
MSRRPAAVTQADIARSLRAIIAQGLKVARVVTRADGVAIETVDCPSDEPPTAAPPISELKKPIVL